MTGSGSPAGRHFKSSIFQPASGHPSTTRTVNSTTTVASGVAVASNGTSISRSKSTPRSGSISASSPLPGRPRVVPAGSSSTTKQSISAGPLANGLAAGGARSSSTSRQGGVLNSNTEGHGAHSPYTSFPSRSSSTGRCSAAAAAMDAAYSKRAAVGSKCSNIGSERLVTVSSSRAAMTEMKTAALHNSSSISLEAELRQLRIRQQSSGLVKDITALQAAQPPSSVSPRQALSVDSSRHGTSRQDPAQLQAAAAAAVEKAVDGSGAANMGLQYLQRLQRGRLEASISHSADHAAFLGGSSSTKRNNSAPAASMEQSSAAGRARVVTGTTGTAAGVPARGGGCSRDCGCQAAPVQSQLAAPLHHQWPLYNPQLYAEQDQQQQMMPRDRCGHEAAGAANNPGDMIQPGQQQHQQQQQHAIQQTAADASDKVVPGQTQQGGAAAVVEVASLLREKLLRENQAQLAERLAAEQARANAHGVGSHNVQQNTATERARQRVVSAGSNGLLAISTTAALSTSTVDAAAQDLSSSRSSRDQSDAGHRQYSTRLQHQYSMSAHGQQAQTGTHDIGELSGAAGMPSTRRSSAHSGSLNHIQLPHVQPGSTPGAAVIGATAAAGAPLRAPHPVYTVQPQLQPQLQWQSSNTAAAGTPALRVSDTSSGGDDAQRRWSSGSSTTSGGVGPAYTSAAAAHAGTVRSQSSSQILYGTANSTFSSISSTSSQGGGQVLYETAHSTLSADCAPGVGSSATSSPFEANNATSKHGGSSASVAGSERSSIGRSSSTGGSTAYNDSMHMPVQQQQSGLSRLASGGSTSAMLATRQESFLIGTQPLSEDLDDTSRSEPLQSPGVAASVAHRGWYSGCSTGDEQDAAASRQAASQFLACSFSSRANSMTAQEGQELPQQQQLQQQTRRQTTGNNANYASTFSNSIRHPLQDDRVQEATSYHHVHDADSDSEISEISTSVGRCSSSDSSDSEDCRSAQPDWKRRLAGGHALSSSASISTEDRSSSCGSGRELEHVCSFGKQGSSSLGASGIYASKNQPPLGCIGLNNLGNTCFMNSILQCLNCLPELVVALLGPKRAASCIAHAATTAVACVGEVRWGARASVGPALCQLLNDMWSGTGQPTTAAISRRRAAVSPRQFLAAVAAADERWGDGRQQDSQEFLHSLLEQLKTECNRVLGKPQYKELSSHGTVAQQAAEATQYARSWHDSLVDDLFGGQLQSTITCSSCKAQSHCFDPFLDLSVPIPKSKQVSLQDCLQAFVEQEALTGSEQVRCSACKKTCNATKRLQIYSYPSLLVLTLKRFSSGRSSGGALGGSWLGGGFSPYSKNQTPVKLDAQHLLDLQPYCNPEGVEAACARGRSKPQYQLLAVSEHSGCLGGGHYTAQGRSVADGCWYDFNDSSVTPNNHPCGSSSSAYVLFFRLVSA